MNKVLLVSGLFLILMAYGTSEADSITSSIVCDGASWVASSVIGQGQTYAASLFTTDIGALMRNLNVGNDGTVHTVTNARSTGPIGVTEYSSQGTNPAESSEKCMFTLPENGTPNQDEITYLGLLQTGEYVSTRTLDSSQTGAITMVNGSGMVLGRAVSTDGANKTTHTSDVAGTVNMTERIVFGEEK